MITLRVLGVGSPFGDDQLGWDVVKQLEQCPDLNPFIPCQLQLICCDRPGMHLLELMKDANTVFLIDAIKTGAAYGTLHCFKNQDIECIRSPLSSHSLGVAEAMKLGRALNELPPNVFLYGIEIDAIDNQASRSDLMINTVNELSKQVKDDILQWLSL